MYSHVLEVRDVLRAMILLTRQCAEYTDFYILILRAATLVNLFISSNRFLVDENSAFFMCKITSSKMGIAFLLPFHSGCLLFHFLAYLSG